MRSYVMQMAIQILVCASPAAFAGTGTPASTPETIDPKTAQPAPLDEPGATGGRTGGAITSGVCMEGGKAVGAITRQGCRDAGGTWHETNLKPENGAPGTHTEGGVPKAPATTP